MGKHKKSLNDKEVSKVVSIYNAMLEAESLIKSLAQEENIDVLNSFMLKKIGVCLRSIRRILSYYTKRWDTVLPIAEHIDQTNADQ